MMKTSERLKKTLRIKVDENSIRLMAVFLMIKLAYMHEDWSTNTVQTGIWLSFLPWKLKAGQLCPSWGLYIIHPTLSGNNFFDSIGGIRISARHWKGSKYA
jgi:hypothetical protein